MKRYQQQFKALGSEVVITLVGIQAEGAIEVIFESLHDKIHDFEERFSRFIEGSELTSFNKHAGQKTKVSSAFTDLLGAAKDLSIKTDEIYNPFILPALQRAGYLASWNNDFKVIDYTDRRLFSVKDIQIGDNWAKIPEDSAIDFGGIGKGYLLDELHTFLLGQGLEGYWVSLGGDIVCSGYDLDKSNWSVSIQDASDSHKSVGKISNNNGQFRAIATSGTTKRKGIKNGKAWHHIIDPRTGEPAKTDILTATITAGSATEADVFCKCILIEGKKSANCFKAKALIQSYLVQLSGDQATIIKS
ncbi:MAG TPA: FAD:protein FMN transferase [Candidatus Saccharimonadales bacterium]